MNLQTMEYVIVLARERSFTRAAEVLHITQQSLSGHIAAVEQELGAQLVVRRTPLELTYAGRAFLRHAEAIRQEELALRQELCDITGEQRGQLRIGVAFTRSKAILPDIVTAFQQEYPNVELCILENANERFHRALLDGEIDLAIANFPASLPEIELEPFYHEDVVLLASRALLQAHGLTQEQCARAVREETYAIFRDCPFVLGSRAQDLSGLAAQSALRTVGAPVRVRARSDNADTMITLCERGCGICFCSELLLRALRSERQLEPMLVLRLPRKQAGQIRFAYRKKPYQWQLLSAFLRIARQCVREP